MSRDNNDLPMLPPWLSENDVTQTGYEAPVQNLPHADYIPEDSAPRRRFSRKSDDQPEPEKKKRKPWRKDKAAEQPRTAESSWEPPHAAAPTSGDTYELGPAQDSTYGSGAVQGDAYGSVPTHGSTSVHGDAYGSAAAQGSAYDSESVRDSTYDSEPMPWQQAAGPEAAQGYGQGFTQDPAYQPAPARPTDPRSGQDLSSPPESGAQPMVPPAPQQFSGSTMAAADALEAAPTTRVTRTTDEQAARQPQQGAPQAQGAQQAPAQHPARGTHGAPTPPPVPDWSAASPAPAEQAGPPPRLGIPEGHEAAEPATGATAEVPNSAATAHGTASAATAPKSTVEETAPAWVSGPIPAQPDSAAQTGPGSDTPRAPIPADAAAAGPDTGAGVEPQANPAHGTPPGDHPTQGATDARDPYPVADSRGTDAASITGAADGSAAPLTGSTGETYSGSADSAAQPHWSGRHRLVVPEQLRPTPPGPAQSAPSRDAPAPTQTPAPQPEPVHDPTARPAQDSAPYPGPAVAQQVHPAEYQQSARAAGGDAQYPPSSPAPHGAAPGPESAPPSDASYESVPAVGTRAPGPHDGAPQAMDVEATTVAPQGFSQPRMPQQRPPTGEQPIAGEYNSGGYPADPQQGPPNGPDQYAQPQQYAQPDPYTQGRPPAQGQQYGSAEQYQQVQQYPQGPQYQQDFQYQQGPQYQQGQAPQYQQGQQYSQPPQYQQGSAPQYGPNGPGPSLEDVPMRRAKKAPGSGWRRAVHHMSGGAINPGMSAEELRLQELVARIRQPVRGDYRIATLSLKGGVGKTTTTMGIGSIFASIRGDRVIAVDANPDFGTLSQRVPLQTRSSVRDLLLDRSIGSYGDVRRHTSQATSRLEVLASERDPAASESFSEDEYRQVLRVLQRFYNIILTDCGTGLMHSAMAGVLDLAHSLVLISSSAIDGARSAAATLDWLSLHGHDHLVRNAVVVINLPREGSPNVAIQHLREYFLARCRAVHVIPYDPHLAEGAEIDLARLHKNTKRALVELAATVADDFATDHRHFGGY